MVDNAMNCRPRLVLGWVTVREDDRNCHELSSSQVCSNSIYVCFPALKFCEIIMLRAFNASTIELDIDTYCVDTFRTRLS